MRYINSLLSLIFDIDIDWLIDWLLSTIGLLSVSSNVSCLSVRAKKDSACQLLTLPDLPGLCVTITTTSTWSRNTIRAIHKSLTTTPHSSSFRTSSIRNISRSSPSTIRTIISGRQTMENLRSVTMRAQKSFIILPASHLQIISSSVRTQTCSYE